MALAAHALGLAAMWKSTNDGDGAGLRAQLGMSPSEQMLGWVNVGTVSDVVPRERNPVDLRSFATVLEADGLAPYEPLGS